MNTHLTEDELILHYYGEIEGADHRRVESHSMSGAMSDRQEALARVMEMVDTASPVEATARLGGRVGAARAGLDANRGGGASSGSRSGRCRGWRPCRRVVVAGRFSGGDAVTTTPAASSRTRAESCCAPRSAIISIARK